MTACPVLPEGAETLAKLPRDQTPSFTNETFAPFPFRLKGTLSDNNCRKGGFARTSVPHTSLLRLRSPIPRAKNTIILGFHSGNLAMNPWRCSSQVLPRLPLSFPCALIRYLGTLLCLLTSYNSCSYSLWALLNIILKALTRKGKGFWIIACRRSLIRYSSLWLAR